MESNADVNAEDLNGDSPLLWASEEGHTAIVRYLLSVGANSKELNVLQLPRSGAGLRSSQAIDSVTEGRGLGDSGGERSPRESEGSGRSLRDSGGGDAREGRISLRDSGFRRIIRALSPRRRRRNAGAETRQGGDFVDLLSDDEEGSNESPRPKRS